MRRLRYRIGFWLYGIANRLDPGAEHEFFVCPECNREWSQLGSLGDEDLA